MWGTRRGGVGEDVEEGAEFDFAGGAEAGGDGVEGAVVVAGVGDELPEAVGHGGEELAEGGFVEAAGGGDAEGSGGGEDFVAADLREGVEAGAEGGEEFELEAAEGVGVADGERPGLLEGVADGGDAAAFGDEEESAGDGGEDVGVLVGVDVGDVDAGALEALDLGGGFADDVFFVDLAEEGGEEEVGEGGAEGFGVAAEEGGDAVGVGEGCAVGEDDVAADAEGGMGAGDGDGVVEGGAVGHEGGGGEGAGVVELGDGAVDAWSEPEVVGVEDEAGGHGGVGGRGNGDRLDEPPRRGFLILADGRETPGAVEGMDGGRRAGVARGRRRRVHRADLLRYSGGMPAKSQRNHVLDLMRLIFALVVVIAHGAGILDNNFHREILTQALGGRVFAGIMAVDGFFLLSGYLIVRSWMYTRSLGDYLQKRFLRIIPGYVVAFVVSVLLAGGLAPGIPHLFATMFHWHWMKRLLVSFVLVDSPIMPPVFPAVPLPDPNGSMWTISYEIRCYLLVALLGSLGLLRKRWVWLGLTVVAFVGFVVLGSRVDPGASVPWWMMVFTGKPSKAIRLLTVFGLGGCFYLFREEIPLKRWMCWTAGLMLPVALWFFPAPEAFFMVLGGYVLFYIERHSTSSAWMQRFPDVSYGVYLYGWPIESLWLSWKALTLPAAIVISCVVSLGAGWLSWHFVERPMLKLKRRATAEMPAG
jgi:peptidoglycan/LPS O-acetylase OafA/YrhL